MGTVANNDLQNIDLNNPEFQDAWDVLQHTHRSVFLTGKAGTGKSTFLKYIRDTIKKKTFFDKHPVICGFLISLVAGIVLLFSFWEKLISFLEGLF